MNTNEEVKEKLRNLFDTVNLNDSLRFSSVFIAVYENFKATMIQSVKDFYFTGIRNGKAVYRNYDNEVLQKVETNKDCKTILATTLWLKNKGCFSDEDRSKFKDITILRDKLAHDLLGCLIIGLNEGHIRLFVDLIELFTRFDKWWLREVEIPTEGISPDKFKNIDWDGVASINILLLKIISDIALTGNNNYIEIIDNL